MYVQKIILIAPFLLGAVSCRESSVYALQPSPSGRFQIQSMVERIDSSHPDYAMVVFRILNADGKELSILRTHASDAMFWYVDWSFAGDTIVLASSDIGNRCWIIQNGQVLETELTPSLELRAYQMRAETIAQ